MAHFIKIEVEFERGQTVYSILEPNDAFIVRGITARGGEQASYLCFNPEYGEVEFQVNEISDTRNFM